MRARTGSSRTIRRFSLPNAAAILESLARGMPSFDRATAKYWCEWLEVGLENITTCADLNTLTLWFDRSLTATTAQDLFTDG
ncbi:hypothetical protein G3I77_11555 [Streptomyces sp. D2-8]|uniref:hypothetical protein n=1 Tax=Streptomyces sp. D2-8 TaxID=2707767 RepID=UPI0020BE3EC1|nr:hypothetical protein [Streptomyces sp. D2-8]MCK8433650.1 hypothetical protein [Streptomyces sp. D2-8]